MSFDKLIHKVHQAEDALEARERQVSADIRQFKRSWRAAWTPGRIVIAGLVSGFAIGRAQPVRAVARSGSMMQVVSMLSTLFAGTSAKAAAEEAEQAAEVADDTAAATVGRHAAAAPATRSAASEASPDIAETADP